MTPNGMEPEQFVERFRRLIAQLEMATNDAHKAEVQAAAKQLCER